MPTPKAPAGLAKGSARKASLASLTRVDQVVDCSDAILEHSLRKATDNIRDHRDSVAEPDALLVAMGNEWIRRGNTFSVFCQQKKALSFFDLAYAFLPAAARKWAKKNAFSLQDTSFGRSVLAEKVESSDPDPLATQTRLAILRLLDKPYELSALAQAAKTCRPVLLSLPETHLASISDGVFQALLSAEPLMDEPTSLWNAPQKSLLALGSTLCDKDKFEAFTARVDAAVAERHGAMAWVQTSATAIHNNSIEILDVLTIALIARFPKALAQRHNINPYQPHLTDSLLCHALREGHLTSAHRLLDLGAMGGHLVDKDKPLATRDNPFAALRAWVLAAAGKPSHDAAAPAQLFSRLAKEMSQGLLAQGTSIDEAKLFVESAIESANKHLRTGKSKSAFESLILEQTLALAQLGVISTTDASTSKRAAPRL
jgi:hypothetical protein